jgi:prophage antirepressor-like protein
MSPIKLFESRQVRAVWNSEEEIWYFAVSDVIQILTDTTNVTEYTKKMRKRDPELAKAWIDLVPSLWVDTEGGRQKMACANTQGLLRIVQSIPSPKAEPFRLWLAQVGYERLEEIENPELAMQRTRELYQLKGYPDDWIERRMRSIAIREELTDQWNQHGVKPGKEYALLTAEISKATFGLTPSQYKLVKELDRENLRDHMTDLELLFSMLGEASTTEIVKTQHPVGYTENKKAAQRGGDVAGKARRDLERQTGQTVISRRNFLPQLSGTKQLTKPEKKNTRKKK